LAADIPSLTSLLAWAWQKTNLYNNGESLPCMVVPFSLTQSD
jgi:hypothetical protein